jgi:uncharacterized protein YyaL (SSP411 family)
MFFFITAHRGRWLLAALLLMVNCRAAESSQAGSELENTVVKHSNEAVVGRPNRLINAQSPYLLQHAYNPVDWYEWSAEAFDVARQEDKPIFLSIGYSTCHWCHVMAHESFEDPEVARLLNEAFVCIKVDREERPDIDHLYMAVCQMLIGHGGWPLTIVMTPDKEPFFAGTYFPREGRYGRMGMLDLIPRLSEVWKNDRAQVARSTDAVLQALRQSRDQNSGDQLGEQTLQAAFEQARSRFDPEHGGFGSRPKFPTPHQFLFLLRYWYRTREPAAMEMVEQTLSAMRLGGIYDHVGFGFHRYSTDEQWLVPHFEKMLYDQAMLTMAYTETYLATGKETHARTVEEIITYVLRDMTAPEGGFYSAEDADSEGEEGKFYLWTEDEIRQVLTPEDAGFVTSRLNTGPTGNFHEESTGMSTGTNILHLASPLDDPEHRRWERLRPQLFEHREKRIHPHKDDKILTDWNGLMIAALARAGQALGRPDYITAAEKAARFILSNLRNDQGALFHRYRAGHAGITAHIDDYAFTVWGLLDLYEATFNTTYLQIALELNNTMLDKFWDDQTGGLFFTPDDGEALLVRSKEIYDGAVPSGNSVAALNLLRLGRITSNPALEARAAAISQTFSGQVSRSPVNFTQLLSAMEFGHGPSYEVVIAGTPGAVDTGNMLSALRGSYHPNKVVILHPADDGSSDITRLAPFIKSQTSRDGKATAYVCRNYACQAPTTEVDAMLVALEAR